MAPPGPPPPPLLTPPHFAAPDRLSARRAPACSPAGARLPTPPRWAQGLRAAPHAAAAAAAAAPGPSRDAAPPPGLAAIPTLPPPRAPLPRARRRRPRGDASRGSVRRAHATAVTCAAAGQSRLRSRRRRPGEALRCQGNGGALSKLGPSGGARPKSAPSRGRRGEARLRLSCGWGGSPSHRGLLLAPPTSRAPLRPVICLQLPWRAVFARAQFPEGRQVLFPPILLLARFPSRLFARKSRR